MKTYVLKVLVKGSVIEVSITTSGIHAAEKAALSMYPGGRVLSWR